jgi:hypothetical protein
MISCLPVSFENMAAIGLANASVPPPAGNGTIKLTAFEGQAAWAQAVEKEPAAPIAVLPAAH